MKLLKTEISEVSEDRKRITGFVEYNDGYIDEYWYEYPAHFDITDSGNPWLAALLPMAATINEDLEISLPIDQRLLDGANDIMRFWHSWDKSTYIVKINAENIANVGDNISKDAASFFSSGVDAFYTAYNKPRANYKILIHGFDLSINKETEFETHLKRISDVVKNLGEELVFVKTNIRHTRWKQTRWQAISHGAALASIGLLFEKHFSEIFIPSSMGDYSDLYCWGSHPLTDPLYSTSKTNIITDGDGLSRLDKIKFLADYDYALKHLHVCIRGKDGTGQDEVNCSHCEKCYRTMIALELANCLEKCDLFDVDKYNYEEIPYMFVTDAFTAPEYHEMAEEALMQNKLELASAIYKAIRRSKLIIRLGFLKKVPFLWYIPHKMMENSIY